LQDYGLLPWATVRQNAELGLKVQAFYGPDGTHAPRERRDIRGADAWLERLGLAGLADRFPQKLSGGQRQRTAIARTLAIEPDLLLMDEPFSSLDAPTREDLQNLMLRLWREQQFTMLLVTHSIEEAAILGQKILLMGRPPHTHPVIIDNPRAANPDFRATREYHDLCVRLRALLEAAS
jgi:NitT/TauT family transport system ATP-binding protein